MPIVLQTISSDYSSHSVTLKSMFQVPGNIIYYKVSEGSLLHPTTPITGCSSSTSHPAAFFCEDASDGNDDQTLGKSDQANRPKQNDLLTVKALLTSFNIPKRLDVS